MYDQREACCHLGVPAESHCRMCQARWVGRMGGKGGVPARALAEERCPSCDVELGEQDRAQRRCHRCGAQASQEADRAREPIEEVGQFRAALDRWALEEGCRDGAELLETSFGGVSVEEAWARFSQGERLETTDRKSVV